MINKLLLTLLLVLTACNDYENNYCLFDKQYESACYSYGKPTIWELNKCCTSEKVYEFFKNQEVNK